MFKKLILMLLLVLTVDAFAEDTPLTLSWSPPTSRVNGEPFTVKEIKYYYAEWYDDKNIKLSSDTINDPNAVQLIKTVPSSIKIAYVMLKVCDINELCSTSVKVESKAITRNSFKPPTNLRVN